MVRTGRRIVWLIALLALSSCTAKKETVVVAPPPLPPARIEVARLQITANREFVGARIRVVGDGVDPDEAETFLVDEATGEKFPVVRLQRIGRKAEFSAPGEKGTRYVMFRNRDGRLKAGKRVTLQVGNVRQEQLLIQP